MNAISDSPAVFSPTWLPTGGIDELDGMREQHMRILDARNAALREQTSLKHRFEEEDKEQEQAVQDSLRTGDKAKAAKLTPQGEREAAIKAAFGQAKAAEAALEDFVAEVMAFLSERQEQIADRIDAEKAEAEEVRQRLIRELETESSRVSESTRLSRWVERTVMGGHQHVAYDDLGAPPVESDEPIGQQMERALAQ